MNVDYGWLSVIPPVAAIILAIATRRVVLSLAFGVLVASFILKSEDSSIIVFAGTVSNSLIDLDHIKVFGFTSLMGAMVALIHQSGGMKRIIELLAPVAKTRRGGQMTTWGLGLIVFIDDYANTLLLGNTMRSVCDRLRISREKLAYIVDSTAAPVSGLALISTWIATEVSYIEEGFKAIGDESYQSVSGFQVFIQTIPYRFYVLWALLFVPVVAWMGRDFGPMLKAERATLADKYVPGTSIEQKSGSIWAAILPIVITVCAAIALLWTTGSASLAAAAKANEKESQKQTEQNANTDTDATDSSKDEPTSNQQKQNEANNQPANEVTSNAESNSSDGSKNGESAEQDTGLGMHVMEVIGNGDSYTALLCGSALGFLAALIAVLGSNLLSGLEAGRAIGKGILHVVPALAILWMSWSLQSLTKALGTGEFLGDLIVQAQSQSWATILLPTLVFVLSGIVAFSTGTSWGTMAILLPIVIPLCHRILGDDFAVNDAIVLASTGSVLAGAIFGDHCSPISDTTVLSSQASGCDHVAHVWTQMPYALLVGVASIILGTLPIGLGVPYWILLPVGFAALVIFHRLVGKKLEKV